MGYLSGPVWVRNPHERGAYDSAGPVVQRASRVDRPNQLWVANFTYVATWRGVVYMTFMIDLLARRIVGLRGHNTLRTDFMWNALKQTAYDRETDGQLVHHSARVEQ